MDAESGQLNAIRKLNSSGPSGQYKDKLMLFGQFVGDWNIEECRSLREDGTWEVTKGELHWGWILDGRAVQDIWMTTEPATWEMGTTVRFYDPKIDAWQSTWISPGQGVVRKFIGRKVNGEILLETKEIPGTIMHWIFLDIERDAFRWRCEKSMDGGKTWAITEEMSIIRQKD